MTDELHIAGVVVHVLPEALASVEQAFTQYPEMQVHGSHPDGKLVVTLEGASANHIMDQISEIRQIAGVLNVSLVYQHTEPRQSFNEGITHD